MKKSTNRLLAILVLLCFAFPVHAKDDDFKSVVKMIEQFYGVKHQGLPFLARAGLKVVGAGARIKGGDARRFAEAGSIKLALFEDQKFSGDFLKFRASLNNALNLEWTPLIQTFSATDQEQAYIFLRNSGDKWNVLVITIEPSDAVVVQANISQKSLVELLKDPEGATKSIIREAAITDQE